MSQKPTVIHFVTWPDGRVVEGSQTSISEDMAVSRTVQKWLIPEYFPNVEYGHICGGGLLRYLWPSMKKAGFKVQSVQIPADGVSF